MIQSNIHGKADVIVVDVDVVVVDDDRVVRENIDFSFFRCKEEVLDLDGETSLVVNLAVARRVRENSDLGGERWWLGIIASSDASEEVSSLLLLLLLTVFLNIIV